MQSSSLTYNYALGIINCKETAADQIEITKLGQADLQMNCSIRGSINQNGLNRVNVMTDFHEQ